MRDQTAVAKNLTPVVLKTRALQGWTLDSGFCFDVDIAQTVDELIDIRFINAVRAF